MFSNYTFEVINVASLSITLLFVRLYHYHDLVIESHSIAKFSSLSFIWPCARGWWLAGGTCCFMLVPARNVCYYYYFFPE